MSATHRGLTARLRRAAYAANAKRVVRSRARLIARRTRPAAEGVTGLTARGGVGEAARMLRLMIVALLASVQGARIQLCFEAAPGRSRLLSRYWRQ